MSEFVEYVKHGWKLCRIEPKTKGPRDSGWNLEANLISVPSVAEKLVGAGLCHSNSGTCAIDVDRYDDAEKFLQEHGIDLNALFSASDAVQISSGRKNRGKLLYRLDTPLFTIKPAGGALEFRCQAKTGNTVQDVLPPTIHPDTGNPYKWVGDWKQLPTLPDPLKALWLLLLSSETPREPSLVKATSAKSEELRDLLTRKDPNCGYEEWIKIGMALHHETGGNDEGFAIWDEFSAPGDSYPGIDTLRSHWVSFGRSATPITADSLRKTDTASADQFEDLTTTTGDWFDEKDKEPLPAQPVFSFLSLSELFKRPEPVYRIQGVLPESGLGCIFGQPGGGKTFIGVDLALSVALGGTWRGISASQGSCLYVAAEDDRGVQMRFAAGLAARGVPDAPIRVLPAAPVFTSPEQQKMLLPAIRACGPQAITFVDTLAAVTPGSDENTAKDMSQLIHFCQKIQRTTGGLVLLVHHEGKTTGRGPRGWSGLHGAFDMEWEVSDEESFREMRITKMKNAPTGDAYKFQLIRFGKSCVVEWI